MPLLRLGNQLVGSDDFQFREANNRVKRGQQTGRLGGGVAAIAVVVVEWQFFVFVVVFFVVFVVGIVQLHKIHNTYLLLLTSKVMDKMMKKCAHFEEGLHSLTSWRTGRQNLEGKEDGQKFFHFRGKGRGFGGFVYLYFLYRSGLFYYYVFLF